MIGRLLLVLCIFGVLGGVVIPTAIDVIGETEAATTGEITITKIPCYPQTVIQLDQGAPLIPGCDAYYTAYMNDFWNEMTKDVIFLDGNATADVYNIGIYWEVDEIVCERVRERGSAGFYVD